MKIIKLIPVFVFLYGGIGILYGQVERENYLGIRYSYGACDYSRGGAVFGSLAMKDYKGKDFYILGLDYAHRTSKHLDLLLGFTFINNKLTIKSIGSSSTSDNQLFIFSFPVHLKYHFLKYLFIDGGFCVNVHPSLGYKWGAGVGIGVGGEYMFSSGITVSIYPFMQWDLLNFNIGRRSESIGGIDIMSQKGIGIGLGYQF